MMSKKISSAVLALLVVSSLSACVSTGNSANINSARSKNAMMISDSEAKQQTRQRYSELEETSATNAKARMNMGTVREGMETLREGIGLINYIKGVF